ncbi:cytochrome P450 [Actinokineospora auranticolor]|nr:cytochrome P450 [Actinokineospora auranticolor]
MDDAFVTDPYPVLARLLDDEPVCRAAAPDGTAVWLVTRYADVRAALTDPRLSLDNRWSADQVDSSLPPVLQGHLLNMDSPAHTRIRRLVTSAFTARRVEGLRERMRVGAERLLDRLPPDAADLVDGLAMPLPLLVIGDLLGIPADDRDHFRDWTNTLVAPDPEAAQRSRRAMAEMHAYLVELVERKRAEPRSDVLTALITADGLSRDELVALVFLLLFGGYDTTASGIGTALLALLRHPRHAARVRDGSLPMSAVAEEALRWVTPFSHAVRRFAVEDIRIDGVEIPAGSRVWLSLAAANRDPRQFPDPDDFDPDRGQGGHLAFGHGVHFCVGAALARLQIRLAATALLHRFPHARLVDPDAAPLWRVSFRTRGLRELRVHL